MLIPFLTYNVSFYSTNWKFMHNTLIGAVGKPHLPCWGIADVKNSPKNRKLNNPAVPTKLLTSPSNYVILYDKDRTTGDKLQTDTKIADIEEISTLFDLRIGAVPDTVIHRISRIRSRSRLDILLEQVATAQKLDDIEW